VIREVGRMTRYSRMMSLPSAAATVAALTWAVTWSAPASAAEGIAATDVSAKSASAMERRHGPSRVALSRYARHVSAVPARLDCTGTWCGRHFVLIIGIGY
jgi:hypothetical protein